MITKPKIPVDLEKVKELAAHGQSQGQIAINLGISRSTLQNRKRENEQFDQAIKEGKAIDRKSVV